VKNGALARPKAKAKSPMEGKLLLHISDRDKWPTALALIKALVDQSQWKIVVIADIFAVGICVACNKILSEQMQALVEAGHKILLCRDSLQALNIPDRNLPAFMSIIPNALAEIIKRQAEGYRYIKV
jgi:intracellular sulfur oxidation DsrE/DsrF family protein